MRFSKFLPVFIFTGVALTYPIPNDARGFLDGLSSLFGGGGGGGSSETTPDTKTVAPLGASPRTLRASNPPTKDDVVKSITNWGTSVCFPPFRRRTLSLLSKLKTYSCK